MELATAPGAMPLSISVHDLPPSCVRQRCALLSSTRSVLAAAYAVRSSKWPASMLKIRVHGLICAGVTLLQLVPPSMVTWTLPSSVPAQITLTLRGDGDSAVMEPCGDGVTVLPYLPVFAGTAQVWRVRSGLMRVQLCARSVLFHTAFDAQNSTSGRTGDHSSGIVRTLRP